MRWNPGGFIDCEIRCGDGVISVMDVKADTVGADGETGVDPGSISKGGWLRQVRKGVVIDTNVAFICSDTRFVNNGHISRHGEVT